MADQSLRASVTLVDLQATTTRVVPVAELDYVLLVVSASMDTSGRYRYMTDVAVVAEGLTFSTSKALVDAGTPVDAISLEALKVLADGFAMNDGSDIGDGSVYSFTKGISNVAFPEDALAQSLAKLSQDQFELIDNAAKVLSRPLVDSTGTTDDNTVAALKGLSDSAELQDAIATLLLFIRNFSDSAPVDDAAALAVSLPKADQSEVSDTYVLEAQKLFADEASAADNFASIFETAFSDSTEPDDVRTLFFTASRVESTTMTDAGVVSIQDYCALGYFAEDYVGLSQAF